MLCAAVAILVSLNSPFPKVMIPIILIGLTLTLIQKVWFQIFNGACIRTKQDGKFSLE